MNKFGVHALVWAGDLSGPSVQRIVTQSKKAGYDLVEFSLHDLSELDIGATRALLEENGIEPACSRGLAFDADVSSDNLEVVARGVALLEESLEVAQGLGAKFLCGGLYSAFGKYHQPVSALGRRHVVESLKRVADSAAKRDITLGLEIVNRYESNVVNTTEQALDVLEKVGAPHLKIHLDIYHMNIEEADFFTPVLACGDKLGYVHIGENHRGYLGSGHLDFSSFFHALAHIGYTGPIAFESFSDAVVSRGLSVDLSIWRNLWNDGFDLANHARQFMQNHADAAVLGRA
ncbi:sugar phosphate isomerase/epimerase family protein [Acidisoma silvae]|uniref:Sugar phosphate isomerase/epimerase n=1 Tax=Acidisoma silvae TaxID=2802396 RepID=A0A963YVL0_9PROT|nr:sugar phosphate isomerase/epimerase family protein [Acidisoma silvae]MCB8877674.1 sugar phosphate isomerase/epimerase [Acidisoma silvae]